MGSRVVAPHPVLGALALAMMIAVPGRAQQPSTEGQRREIERKMNELEQQMRDLRRQLERLGDGPRVRVEAGTPRARTRVFGPGGFTVITHPPKFGFQVSQEPDSSGAKVMVVTPGTPADRAGLKSGDVITMFNGIRLSGLEKPGEALVRQAADLEVGDTVHAEYRRGSEKKQITMVAEDLDPGAFAYAFGDSAFRVELPKMRMGNVPQVLEFGGMPARWLDMELVSLNRDLGEYFGIAEGVLVVRAPRDTSLNLKSGDVILSIDGRKTSTPAQALRILRSYERGESFEVQILRQKKRMTVTAKIPDRDRGYFDQFERQDNV